VVLDAQTAHPLHTPLEGSQLVPLHPQAIDITAIGAQQLIDQALAVVFDTNNARLLLETADVGGLRPRRQTTDESEHIGWLPER
jgi:hypothetical protein